MGSALCGEDYPLRESGSTIVEQQSLIPDFEI